jgi:peptide-methionine (R)-S-oxide reductase
VRLGSARRRGAGLTAPSLSIRRGLAGREAAAYMDGRRPRPRSQEPIMDVRTFPFTRTDAEWHAVLTPEQYAVMRGHGTERPGSCALLHEKRPGTFTCAGCGQPLFVGGRKFESGTGWPSFDTPVEGAVETSEDRSHGMVRTECHCSRCGSHLGHVFPDGPPPTGLRYCINGVAMNFEPDQG